MTQAESATYGDAASEIFDTVRRFEKYQEGVHILLEGARIQTGLTPKEVVWTKNKARLYHYVSTHEKRFPVPILCVYALINRCYILDLMPSYSLVEHLVSQGFDVYLLDWGTPGEEDKKLTFERYILDYLARAVKKMLRHANAEQCSILGYCMGGTMSAMYAALFPDSLLRNLILLTAPIDFTTEHTGLYGIWTSERHFNHDLLVDSFGNVPGELINVGNLMIKPISNYLGTYVTMWERLLHDRPMDTWLAMNKWVNDGVPFPGEAFRQWIHDFYQQNKLVKGEISLRGQRVELSRISCAVLTIAGKRDHICTLPQAEATMHLISSQDKEFFTLDAGHVGLLINTDGKKKLWPKISTWLQTRSS
ncbi:MAG: class III poly(R)-hydroxyalkanoic acid synthase subunit PhaC [Ktedonobacteraceae bacterium]|nr:class III poly(R)-hydroxyalkanoic acid synthase subunit PhaC [Ktedonobacteraceae bacterium]